MLGFKQLDAKINGYLSPTLTFTHTDEVPDNMLEQMLNIMSVLGRPQGQLKVIHVAGTSGKTSTAYFIASLLKSAGHTVGLTVSPRIDTVRERAMIDLTPLPEAEWAKYLNEFFDIIQKAQLPATYFEFYMAFAYWIFAKLGLEYAVIETGIGGKWDASNVVTSRDKVCVITDIGFDHTEILGETLSAITSEKAAIIKSGNTAFINLQDSEAIEVVEAHCREINASLDILDSAPTGDFMERNFYLAKHVVDFVLQRDGFSELTGRQLSASRNIVIPARAEKVLYRGTDVIMDGSHNPQKLAAFADYIESKYPAADRIILATFGSNKIATLDESMRVLNRLSSKIILSSFKDESLETSKREAIDAQTLIASAEKAGFTSILYQHEALKALDIAIAQSPEQVVVTGSFFLLNHIRPYLLG
ncbi:MAG: hypothetical protein LBT19_02645 [Candidatus Nomurabacteria bacterium]|jgi:dihydrofolate synthase/folylpolyglutamate synthase|nr:hypothetical protein [Candidatus Nomurabacteria bacterium]